VNGSLADDATTIRVVPEKMDNEYCHSTLGYLHVQQDMFLVQNLLSLPDGWVSDHRYALCLFKISASLSGSSIPLSTATWRVLNMIDISSS
jgi:hypothetical protein